MCFLQNESVSFLSRICFNFLSVHQWKETSCFNISYNGEMGTYACTWSCKNESNSSHLQLWWIPYTIYRKVLLLMVPWLWHMEGGKNIGSFLFSLTRHVPPFHHCSWNVWLFYGEEQAGVKPAADAWRVSSGTQLVSETPQCSPRMLFPVFNQENIETQMIYSNLIHPSFQNEDDICAAAMMYRRRKNTLHVSPSCALVHHQSFQCHQWFCWQLICR